MGDMADWNIDQGMMPWDGMYPRAESEGFGECGKLNCRAVTGQVNHMFCTKCQKLVDTRKKDGEEETQED